MKNYAIAVDVRSGARASTKTEGMKLFIAVKSYIDEGDLKSSQSLSLCSAMKSAKARRMKRFRRVKGLKVQSMKPFTSVKSFIVPASVTTIASMKLFTWVKGLIPSADLTETSVYRTEPEVLGRFTEVKRLGTQVTSRTRSREERAIAMAVRAIDVC